MGARKAVKYAIILLRSATPAWCKYSYAQSQRYTYRMLIKVCVWLKVVSCVLKTFRPVERGKGGKFSRARDVWEPVSAQNTEKGAPDVVFLTSDMHKIYFRSAGAPPRTPRGSVRCSLRPLVGWWAPTFPPFSTPSASRSRRIRNELVIRPRDNGFPGPDGARSRRAWRPFNIFILYSDEVNVGLQLKNMTTFQPQNREDRVTLAASRRMHTIQVMPASPPDSHRQSSGIMAYISLNRSPAAGLHTLISWYTLQYISLH